MRNWILRAITLISTLVLLVSIMLIDLNSIAPTVTALISLCWIAVFVVVNREYLNDKYN